MARITLIRHGKAEMPRIGGDDFERGLIQRGMQNAEKSDVQAPAARLSGSAIRCPGSSGRYLVLLF